MTCHRPSIRTSMRRAAIVVLVSNLITIPLATTADAAIVRGDHGDESVIKIVRATRIEVSFIDMTSDPLLVVKVGTVEHPRNDLSFSEEAAALDQALEEFDKVHRLPKRFSFQPASLREPLLALLRERLMRPGANWNPVKGDVRNGDPYKVIAGEILAAADASPLAPAFAHHGYHFQSTGGIEHVEVDRVPGFGPARLPTEIHWMGLVAVRDR